VLHANGELACANLLKPEHLEKRSRVRLLYGNRRLPQANLLIFIAHLLVSASNPNRKLRHGEAVSPHEIHWFQSHTGRCGHKRLGLGCARPRLRPSVRPLISADVSSCEKSRDFGYSSRSFAQLFAGLTSHLPVTRPESELAYPRREHKCNYKHQFKWPTRTPQNS